jgi:hypothetical protein
MIGRNKSHFIMKLPVYAVWKIVQLQNYKTNNQEIVLN